MSKPKRYSIAEARASLSTIVDQAEAGLEVELTHRGKPVAVVLSLQAFHRWYRDRTRFSSLYKSFLSRYAVAEIGLDGFFESGRGSGSGREVSL